MFISSWGCLRGQVFHSWFPLFSIAIANSCSRSQAFAFCSSVLFCSASSSLPSWLEAVWMEGGGLRPCVTVHALLCFRNSCGWIWEPGGEAVRRWNLLPRVPWPQSCRYNCSFSAPTYSATGIMDASYVICAFWSHIIWRSARNYCNSTGGIKLNDMWLQFTCGLQIAPKRLKAADPQSKCVAEIVC